MNWETLAATPAFQNVDRAVLESVLGTARPIRLSPHDYLFRTGEEFRGEVFVLESGRLAVTRANRPPEYPGPGFLVGLSSYVTGAPYGATAQARDSCLLLVLAAERLRELEQAHPSLAAVFDRLIGASLRQRRVAHPAGAGALTARVDTVMSQPLARCDPDTPLATAVRMMLDAKRGSLVIESANGDCLVSFASLAEALCRPDINPTRDFVTTACRPLLTIDASEPLWKAQDKLLKTGAKYVLVEDEGAPVGMISQTDLLRVVVARQAQLAASVQRANDFEQLRERYDAMVDLAAEFLETNRLARVAVRSLSEAHLAVQNRCIELTLEKLIDDGKGEPPAAFALIIMGSGGRKEMMLDPDQDNGLILADDCGSDQRVHAWFERFATDLNINLDRCGYVLCPGEIMARNPAFRKLLSHWQAQIRHMGKRPNEKAARWSNVVFDFDTQYGDANLTSALRETVNETLAKNSRLLNFMVEDDAEGRAPLTWFNRLITTRKDDGKQIVDVKRNGLRMVTNAARILSLSRAVGLCNTSDRIMQLSRIDAIREDLAATVLDAYDELLGILLWHQVRQRRQGRTPDKQVAPDDLTPPERESLRVSMRAVKRFQETLQSQIGGR